MTISCPQKLLDNSLKDGGKKDIITKRLKYRLVNNFIIHENHNRSRCLGEKKSPQKLPETHTQKKIG